MVCCVVRSVHYDTWLLKCLKAPSIYTTALWLWRKSTSMHLGSSSGRLAHDATTFIKVGSQQCATCYCCPCRYFVAYKNVLDVSCSFISTSSHSRRNLEPAEKFRLRFASSAHLLQQSEQKAKIVAERWRQLSKHLLRKNSFKRVCITVLAL